METFKRKRPRCNKTMELSKYLGNHKTCVICSEKKGMLSITQRNYIKTVQ